jgi:hypothetical protein
MRKFTHFFLLAIVAPIAHAQWSGDPLTNTPVHVGTGDQITPLVRANIDGGVWVCWADNSAGSGYRHRVQRFDAAGVAQFPPGGIQINTRSNTAVFVYDMAVDASGWAYVAYDNNGIQLQQIEPDGTLWGTNGEFLPGSTGAVGAQVCVTGDGNPVVCWALSNVLNFARVDAFDLSVLSSWTLAEAGRGQAPSDLIPSGTGSDFIAMWVRSETTNMVTSRKGLKIQKWDDSDAQVWNSGTPIDVYASSAAPSRGIQNGYFPRLHADGTGGAVMAWYDTGADRNAWVQHIRSDGSAVFPVNGLAASTTTSATEFRLSAEVSYRALTGLDDYTIVYERSNPAQSQFGLGAQIILENGARIWGGGAGANIVPVSGFHCSFANVNSFPTPTVDRIFTWLQYTGTNGPMDVRSTRLNVNTGAPVCSPAILGVSTSATTKGRLAVVNTVGSDMLIAAWADGASGAGDILAQNININGTIGPGGPTCDSIDFNNDGLFPDTLDIDDFLSVFSGGPCSNDPNCGDIDFNNDGLFPDTLDVDSLLSVFSGGGCL